MRFRGGQVSEAELRAAVDIEFDTPPRQLPTSSLNPALLSRRDEVAQWAHSRLQGTFMPAHEETVAVSKAGHGLRPVAVWDLPSRLAYGALTTRLGAALPAFDRSRAAWREFQKSPLTSGGKYVVATDIASCYQTIDHGLLVTELLAQTGEHETVETTARLVQESSGRTYGLPQQSAASDVLAEAFLHRLERALVRRGLELTRYWNLCRRRHKSAYGDRRIMPRGVREVLLLQGNLARWSA